MLQKDDARTRKTRCRPFCAAQGSRGICRVLRARVAGGRGQCWGHHGMWQELGRRGWPGAGGAVGTEGRGETEVAEARDRCGGLNGGQGRGGIQGDLDFEFGATEGSREGVGRRGRFAERDNELGFGTSWEGSN